MTIELTGRRLRQLLEELDLPNPDAARLCGCSQSSLYRWLNDECPIPASVIRMFEYQAYIERGARLIQVTWAEPEDGGSKA